MYMSEQQKLQEIIKFIRGLKISVKIIRKPNRKDPLSNGCCDGNNIVIYCTNTDSQASEVASVLLHEFGHYIATYRVGLHNHTERDAWRIAGETVPKELKPIEFNNTKKIFLNAYKNAGLGHM